MSFFCKYIHPRHRENTAHGSPTMTKRIGAATGTLLLLASAGLLNFVRGSVGFDGDEVILL